MQFTLVDGLALSTIAARPYIDSLRDEGDDPLADLVIFIGRHRPESLIAGRVLNRGRPSYPAWLSEG